jgi:alpha-N-arabinofuranosidase
MLSRAQIHHFDNLPRNGQKFFVGEWATRQNNLQTSSVSFAIADAAWMTEMENNSDIIVMASYAPLMVNVNPANPATGDPSGQQWATDLIGYNALSSFGSATYWGQRMFYNNVGTKLVAASTDLPADTIFFTASHDDKTGDVILKVVNPQTTAQTLEVDIKGAASVAASASLEVLTGNADAVNTIANPTNVALHDSTIANAGPTFTHEFPPLSASVIRIKVN